MLALRLHPDRSLRIHDEPVPEPGPGEALVRVAAVGLCGSDRHWLLEGGIGEASIEHPLVLGHEIGGTVESGSLAGRRVAIDPAIPCLRCEPCRRGADNLCLDQRFAGHARTDGGLREVMAWPEDRLRPLSDRIDGPECALVEPLAVAVNAVEGAGPLAGGTIAVVGCGPIGLLIVGLARAAGAASIIATDPLAHRRAAAIELGASSAIDPGPDGAERAAIIEATRGRGVDVVFEVAGTPAAIDASIEIARPGGQVVIVGIPAGDRTAFRASIARRKGLTLRLARRSTAASFATAVGIVEKGSLDLGALVTLRLPLVEAERGFEALVERSGIKVVIEPTAAAAAGAGASAELAA